MVKETKWVSEKEEQTELHRLNELPWEVPNDWGWKMLEMLFLCFLLLLETILCIERGGNDSFWEVYMEFLKKLKHGL